MPFIKPRARGKYLHKVLVQLDDQNYETLYAYAGGFIDESTDYVVNELIDALARNKRFRLWRQDHPESFTPTAKVLARREAARRGRPPATSTPRVSDAPATSRGSTV